VKRWQKDFQFERVLGINRRAGQPSSNLSKILKKGEKKRDKSYTVRGRGNIAGGIEERPIRLKGPLCVSQDDYMLLPIS